MGTGGTKPRNSLVARSQRKRSRQKIPCFGSCRAALHSSPTCWRARKVCTGESDASNSRDSYVINAHWSLRHSGSSTDRHGSALCLPRDINRYSLLQVLFLEICPSRAGALLSIPASLDPSLLLRGGGLREPGVRLAVGSSCQLS